MLQFSHLNDQESDPVPVAWSSQPVWEAVAQTHGKARLQSGRAGGVTGAEPTDLEDRLGSGWGGDSCGGESESTLRVPDRTASRGMTSNLKSYISFKEGARP